MCILRVWFKLRVGSGVLPETLTKPSSAPPMIFVREQFSANEVKYLLKPFKYLLKPFDEARLRGSGA